MASRSKFTLDKLDLVLELLELGGPSLKSICFDYMFDLLSGGLEVTELVAGELVAASRGPSGGRVRTILVNADTTPREAAELILGWLDRAKYDA